MKTDLVLDPVGASVPDLVRAAVLAESAGFHGVWTFDHFSGAISGGPWSLDPFVVLGAVAAATERVTVGVLVANVHNRHPAQLASAVSSLQSLAPGRVLCGVGSGADPASRFAVEHHAIGSRFHDAPGRRERLAETIEALRAIWADAGGPGVRFSGRHLVTHDLTAVVGPEPAPPIIVGASGPMTVRLAAEHADGVNIRRTPKLADHVTVARRLSQGRCFEVSVFEGFDPSHPRGGPVDELAGLGVDRRTLVASAPFPFEAIARFRV